MRQTRVPASTVTVPKLHVNIGLRRLLNAKKKGESGKVLTLLFTPAIKCLRAALEITIKVNICA